MTEQLSSRLAKLSPEQRRALAVLARRRADEAKRGAHAPHGDGLAAPAEPRDYPLSFAQERLFVLDRLDPGDPTYTIALGLRLTGPLRTDALRAALASVVADHEALRLTFSEGAAGPRQSPRPAGPVELPVEDLRGHAPDAPEVAERVAAHAATRFDLAAGPAYALRLLILEDDVHLLLLAVHHVVFDGWSGGVFAADLAARYAEATAPADGDVSALPTGRAGIRFPVHVLRERAEVTPEVLAGHLTFWREKLDSAPPLSTVPPDLPRPRVQRHRAGHRDLRLPTELCESLDRLARREGTTVGSVLLAAVAALVQRRSGQADVLLGVPVAGRPYADLDRVVGCFANTVVLRVDAAPDLSGSALIRRVHAAAAEAYAHQAAPFAKVVEAVAPVRDLSRNPLFQVMVGFTELGEGGGRHTVGDLGLELEDVRGEQADFDLFLNLRREARGIGGVLTFDRELYLGQTVDELVRDLVDLLRQLCEPAAAVSAPPASRRRRIAVSSSFTADPVAPVARFWSGILRVPFETDLAPYGQVFQQLLGEGEADASVLLLRWDDWLRRHEGGDAEALLYDIVDDLATAVQAHRGLTRAPLVLVLCPGELASGPTGRRLDDALLRAVRGVADVEVVFAERYVAEFGVDEVFDTAAEELGHVPFTRQFYALLGTVAVRRVLAAWGLDWPGDAPDSERGALLRDQLGSAEAVLERAEPPRNTASVHSGERVAPRTPTEERLAAAWREVLGIADAGVTTDFFADGGTSLAATWLVSRVREEFGTAPNLSGFFARPTIEALAETLDAASGAARTAGGGEAGAPVPVPRDRPLPASSAQERMWVLSELGEAVGAQNTSYALRLRGELSEPRLRSALAGVVARHETLRTVFTDASGRPAVNFAQDVDPWSDTVDVTGAADAERAARQCLHAETGRRFNLKTGPLLRARLIRLAAHDHILFLGMHHAICDDGSWGVLLGELTARYNALAAGERLDLPALPLQFADFAAWQSARLADGSLRADLDYWADRMADAAAPVALPAREGGAGATGAGSTLHRLPAELGRTLREYCRTEGVTVFAAVLAGLSLAFRAETGLEDLTFGTVVSGRDQPGAQDLIGCFADLLPIRLETHGRPSFSRLLQRTFRTVSAALAHQQAPFAAILDAVRARRGSLRVPLFRHVVNYVERPEPDIRFSGLTSAPADLPPGGADFDSFLTLWWEDDDLVVDVRYDRAALGAAEVSGLLARFERALADGLDRPEAAVSAANTAAAPERDRAVLLTLATSSPAEALADVCRFWGDALAVPLRLDARPDGRVFQALLDPETGFPAAGPCALFLRWTDLLRPGGQPGPAAVWELEHVLADLVYAVRAQRNRASAPLALVLVPEPGAAPLAAVCGGLDDRLRAAVGALPGVHVLSGAEWCARYGADANAPMDTQADRDAVAAALATAAVRVLLRPSVAAPSWLAFDAAAWEPTLLARLAFRQSAAGRAIVVAGEPAPLLRGAVPTLIAADAWPHRLGATLAEHGLDPADGFVLDPGSDLGQQVDGVFVVTVPREAEECATFLERLWPLDPAETGVHAEPHVTTTAAARLAAAYPDAAAVLAAIAGPPADRRADPTGPAGELSPAETVLSRIWCDLLRVRSVAPTDDFFALGGDSMLAVEAAYRAGEAGLDLTPRTVASLRTLAAIARATRPGAGDATPAAAPPAPDGPTPLFAAQAWFLEEVAPGMEFPGHYNNPYYLELTQPVDAVRVRAAVARLAAQHDALRVRLHRTDDGWQQTCAPPAGGMPFETVDLADLAPGSRERAATEHCDRLQRSLRLEGPLASALHLRLGEGRDRLFLAVHHLLTDGVTRGLLFEDLSALLRAEHPALATLKTAGSSPGWAKAAAEAAQAEGLREQLPFWLAQSAAAELEPPADRPGRLTFGGLRHSGLRLTESETTRLLEATRRAGRRLNEVLLWAVAGVLAEWSGREECGLAVVVHGRDAFPAAGDTSRTAGWFQTFYPLHLTLPADHADPRTVAHVAAQLAAVPEGGTGWSALRYLSRDPAVRERLRAVRLPRVSFNYMGYFNFDTTSQGTEVFDLCHADYGPEQDADGRGAFDLDFVVSFLGASLNVEVNHDPARHGEDTVRRIHAGVRRRLAAVFEDSESDKPERNGGAL